MRIKPTKADYVGVLRQRATWVEASIGLLVGLSVGVIGMFFSLGPTAWFALPLLTCTPITAAAQRAARQRDLQSRFTS